MKDLDLYSDVQSKKPIYELFSVAVAVRLSFVHFTSAADMTKLIAALDGTLKR